MSPVQRLLPAVAYETIDAYVAAGGGAGLDAARRVEASVLVGEIAASGLRGRGGAGFPTGTKWQTVCDFESDVLSTTVVVNAAEGEPGTLKDRTLMEMNPYAVVEGAMIAALAVGAGQIQIATKASFTESVRAMRRAVEEARAVGWFGDVEVSVVEGPEEYLYGEETALLEVLAGRPPFPRIAPPYRRGIVDVVEDDTTLSDTSGLSADVELATPQEGSLAPVVLANNVETLANVPDIIAKGAAWFREAGTQESPGTILCTLTGSVDQPGVYEVAMGTPLSELIELAGGPAPGGTLAGMLLGVSNAVLLADRFDTPITYEAFRDAGTGLGSASFILFDERADPAALAAGVSRFLAIESCGQCTPCKLDGMEVAARLARIVANDSEPDDLDVVRDKLATIDEGARCNLALQHQLVVGSLLDAFPTAFEAHLERRVDPAAPDRIGELLAIGDEGAVVSPDIETKQADWTHDPETRFTTPVARLQDEPESETDQ